MERATKERLTGAVILVAALAILVPEMLSGPDDQPVSDGAGKVADTGPPLTTYDLAIDPAAAPTAARQQELSGVASEGETIAQAVPPPVTGVALPDDAAADSPAAAAAAPVPSGSTASTVAVDTRAAAEAPSKPPAAVTASNTKVKDSKVAPGSWWVQLGSFSSEQNAQGLARKLRASGHVIEVTRVRSGGKDLYRVRAGPEKDRAAATALRTRLAAAGQSGTLVSP